MAALTAQPAAKTGISLDTGSSLYTGLVAYVVGFSAGSGGLDECYDFVSAAALTAAGTSPTFGTEVGENGFLPVQGNTNRVTLPDSVERDVLGDLTLYWRGAVDSGNGIAHSLISKATGNGTTNTPYDVTVNNSTGQVAVSRANATAWTGGGRLHNTTTGPLTFNALQSVMIASAGTMETIPTIYTNGVARTVTLVAGTGTGNPTGNANVLTFGYRLDNTARHGGLFSLGAIWSRQLTAGEQASFNSNPWQLLDDGVASGRRRLLRRISVGTPRARFA
jgi:hypothetical protein